jgi:hypothetical protein
MPVAAQIAIAQIIGKNNDDIRRYRRVSAARERQPNQETNRPGSTAPLAYHLSATFFFFAAGLYSGCEGL